jgi:hypothetical protein
MKKHEKLFSCTGQFYAVIGFLYVHIAQNRVKNGEAFRPEDFDPY